MKKHLLGIAAAAALAVGSLSVSAEGFAKTNTYTPGMFNDVPASEWYASSVSSSYELGFMKGTADGVFSPEGNMTVAEAVTIAARVHDAYNAKGTAFSQNGANWYDEYVKYAVDNGIIKADAFDDYDRPVKRYGGHLLESRSGQLFGSQKQRHRNSGRSQHKRLFRPFAAFVQRRRCNGQRRIRHIHAEQQHHPCRSSRHHRPYRAAGKPFAENAG